MNAPLFGVLLQIGRAVRADNKPAIVHAPDQGSAAAMHVVYSRPRCS